MLLFKSFVRSSLYNKTFAAHSQLLAKVRYYPTLQFATKRITTSSSIRMLMLMNNNRKSNYSTTTTTARKKRNVADDDDIQYNSEQSKAYVKAKNVDMRNRVELYTTLQFIGNIQNKRVLDVACGSGWLTRHIRDIGKPSYIMGTDISPYMIELAQKEEEEEEERYKVDDDDDQEQRSHHRHHHPKIIYEVEDICNASIPDSLFDVVTSNWLLVNAQNRNELQQMCQGLAKKVKSGGKLVTVVIHPDLFMYPDNETLNQIMKPYGFTFILPTLPSTSSSSSDSIDAIDKNNEVDCLEDGTPIRVQCYAPGGDDGIIFEVDNYYHSKQTYVKELTAAGFVDIEIMDKFLLSPQNDDDDDWIDFFSCNMLMGIVAKRK